MSTFQPADIVFLLLRDWDFIGYTGADGREWSEDERDQWNQNLAQARAMLTAENEKRKQQGLPPRVIGGDDRKLVMTYLPNAKLPPTPKYINHGSREMAQALENMRREFGKKSRLATSLKQSRNDSCTINVIQFVPENGDDDKELKLLASLFKGEYRKLEGMEAIRSFAGGDK